MKNKAFLVIIVLMFIVGTYWYISQSPSAAFALDARDTIASWDFQASHKDGGELEKRVRDEIGRLEERLRDADTEPPDYQLYVGLAGQYLLLGDGASAYKELQKALEIDAEKTGLAWHNMGALMERLGAPYSALEAYDRAVKAQPHIDGYHAAYINFALKQFSEDKVLIEDALARAETQFEDDTFVFQLRAQWLEGQERYEEAIAQWEKIKQGAPPDVSEGIDRRIAELRSKL